MLGSWTHGIFSTSENKELALEFLKWCEEKDVQRRYAAMGGMSVRRSSYLAPESIKGRPWFLTMADVLDAGPMWRPRTKEWPVYADVLMDQLNGVTAGMISLEEAVKVIKENVEAHLDKLGYYR